jgi:hypothetical protein
VNVAYLCLYAITACPHNTNFDGGDYTLHSHELGQGRQNNVKTGGALGMRNFYSYPFLIFGNKYKTGPTCTSSKSQQITTEIRIFSGSNVASMATAGYLDYSEFLVMAYPKNILLSFLLLS